MRRLLSIAFAFAFAAVLLPSSASGQILCRAFPNMSASPPSNGMVTLGLSLSRAPMFEYLVNAPFSGTYQVSHTSITESGKPVESASTPEHWFRDAQGRTRREYEAFGGIQLIEICDPVARSVVLLDIAGRAAYRYSFDPGEPRARKPLQPPSPRPSPNRQFEDLGDQSIEGVYAHGSRDTVTSTGTDGNPVVVSISETWLCSDLDLRVLATRKDQRGSTTAERLKEIVAANPSADLFLIPNDFRVVDESQSFTITVPAPKLPKSASSPK